MKRSEVPAEVLAVHDACEGVRTQTDNLMKIAQHCGVKFHWSPEEETWSFSVPGIGAHDGERRFSFATYPTFHEALAGALGEYQNADSHFLRYGTPGFNFSVE